MNSLRFALYIVLLIIKISIMKTKFIATILTSFIVIGVIFFTSCDGKKYKSVKIGEQEWMAENLNIETPAGSWCYNNDSKNCEKYGRLYDWETAIHVCPSGWHLPSDAEWTTLTNNLGGEDVAGTKMKSTVGWNDFEGKTGNGTNTSGFAGLPGGYRNFFGILDYIGFNGNWWSSTEANTNDAWDRSLNYTNGKVYRYYYYKLDGSSVRCIKDDKVKTDTKTTGTSETKSNTNTEPKAPVTNKPKFINIIDSRDSKNYNTIKIGTQTWMAENLAYKARSGCWTYDNNATNVTKYGYLYDWKTAKKACPSGWHLPSKSDFETLLSNAGGSGNNAYNAHKKGGSSGFSALLGGWRYIDETFSDIDSYGGWWSSSEVDTSSARYLHMVSYSQSARMFSHYKELGLSVRCLQD